MKSPIPFPRVEIHQWGFCRLQAWTNTIRVRPFWRIYTALEDGAAIIWENKKLPLCRDRALFIPPGAAIDRHLSNTVTHLYMHVSFGFPHDEVIPNPYFIDAKRELDELHVGLLKDSNFEPGQVMPVDLKRQADLQILALHCLKNFPTKLAQQPQRDARIEVCLKHIEMDWDQDWNNEKFAAIAGMSTNAFIRLFRQETETSPQHLLLKKRIEMAAIYLHDETQSIDDIAQRCRFYDRYHFSRQFKRFKEIPPASYRKQIRAN